MKKLRDKKDKHIGAYSKRQKNKSNNGTAESDQTVTLGGVSILLITAY